MIKIEMSPMQTDNLFPEADEEQMIELDMKAITERLIPLFPGREIRSVEVFDRIHSKDAVFVNNDTDDKQHAEVASCTVRFLDDSKEQIKFFCWM